MATFVLIHGAMTGGWEWQRVAAGLRAAGHPAYHPSLDGCAERKGGLRPEITLDSQSAEIADLLFYEDLSSVVLVGTSTGGMVVARVAELARERVARLVFIDAVVPLPGETLQVVNNAPPRERRDLAVGPSSEEANRRLFADLEPADRAWALARYTRHPGAPADDPVDLRTF